MNTTEEQERINKVKKWFNDKGLSLVCPLCESKEISIPNISTTVGISRGEPNEVRYHPEENYPLCMVQCKKCANVRLFSASEMGLIE